MRRAILAAVAALLVAAPSASGETYDVTSTADSATPCAGTQCESTRSALTAAAANPGADTIAVPANANDYVLTLGALLGEVPHTRPVRLSGSAYDPELAARLGVRSTRYEGPTGIVGVLNTACREEAIPTASLWANVPHYVSGIENPKAALALVRRVLSLLNTEADLTELSEAARQFEQNLNGIVAQNTKIAEYVAKLEKKKPDEDEEADADADAARDELPPSADLVAEIEQFLRQQHPENP